jgi:hypothetical protein
LQRKGRGLEAEMSAEAEDAVPKLLALLVRQELVAVALLELLQVLVSLLLGGVGDGVASQGLGVYTTCVHSSLLRGCGPGPGGGASTRRPD